MNPLLYLYKSAMTVSDTRWHLLSSDVFFINAVFCGHNIAGINRSKLSFTESLVSFTNPLVSSTNPRCSLLIRGVIYQSAGVNYWSAEKNKMLKTDPKRTQANIYFCPYIWVQWPNFLWKKNYLFTIPLRSDGFWRYLFYSQPFSIIHVRTLKNGWYFFNRRYFLSIVLDGQCTFLQRIEIKLKYAFKLICQSFLYLLL